MPNAPKTPTRTVRVPDDVWHAALAKARAEGRPGGVSEVMVAALRDYVTAG